jgi:hypothetical protein
VTTYAQLVADVKAWIKRSDLDAQIPTFVKLAEAKFNRDLRVRQMEADLTGTIDASNEIAQPSGFLAIKTVWPVGYEASPLMQQSLDSVTATGRITGAPTVYAVTKDALRFNGSGSIAGVYFSGIPGLQANSTNWLATLAPDAYLFGTLAEAAVYTMETQQAALFGARSEAAIQQVQSTDMRDRFNGALAARKR